MTAHTAPINTNPTKHHNLGRWALAAVGLASAAVLTVAIVSAAGNNDSTPVVTDQQGPAVTESIFTDAEPSSYVPGADGARTQAGRPDGGFQAPAVNQPAQPEPTGSGLRLDSGRPDGTWSAPTAPADCQTNRFC